MKINNNKLDDLELVINEISEDDNVKVDSSMISEEMVLSSIKQNIHKNRKLNIGVNHAVYSLLCDDLQNHFNIDEMDM